MRRIPTAVALFFCVTMPCAAQQNVEPSAAAVLAAQPADDAAKSNDDETVIRERLKSYVQTFNEHDAAAVVAFWAADGVSVAEESGERTEGREALHEEFAEFFERNPNSYLSGQVNNVHLLRPDVATIDGRTSLEADGAEPVASAFSAVLIKEGDDWLISSSRERSVPTPPTPYDALRELDWLVGTWRDQAEGAQVTTRIKWASSRAFLLRAFTAQFDDADSVQGTQIIGWDPLSMQIRTWTFNSDGSFGQGTVSKHDNAWMLKMWQILPDGRLASATKIMTHVDDDTMTVQTIGETLDGESLPTSQAVTVVRTDDADVDPDDDIATPNEGVTP